MYARLLVRKLREAERRTYSALRFVMLCAVCVRARVGVVCGVRVCARVRTFTVGVCTVGVCTVCAVQRTNTGDSPSLLLGTAVLPAR